VILIPDTETLTRLLSEAAVAHHDFESRTGVKDESWPVWYARYVVSRSQTSCPVVAASVAAAAPGDSMAGVCEHGYPDWAVCRACDPDA
jgi:hypothetical protein